MLLTILRRTSVIGAISFFTTWLSVAAAAPYKLDVGFTTAIFDWTIPGFSMEKEDYDVIRQHASIVFEFTHGPVPWDVFENPHTYGEYRQLLSQGSPASQAWLQRVDDMKAGHQDLRVYHAEEFIESRLCIRAALNGYPASFLDAQGIATYRQSAARAAAANYAGFLVEHFEPIAFTPFLELNTTRQFVTECPAGPNHAWCSSAHCVTSTWDGDAEWQAIKDTYREIFQRVRAVDPDVPVFPSWQWGFLALAERDEALWGFQVVREFDSIPGAGMDMIALSVYPQYLPKNLPPEVFEPLAPEFDLARAASIVPGGRPLTIEETSWVDLMPYLNQQNYVSWLMAEARKHRMPFLINFYLRDQIIFWEAYGTAAPWPDGLMDPNYVPKPALSLFDDALTYTPEPDLTFIDFHKDGTADPNDKSATVDGIAGAIALAVSPDGAHVYVAGNKDRALTLFRRNRWTGKLMRTGMYRNTAAVDLGLLRVSGVAISPDGAHVYATSSSQSSVSAFARNPTSGELSLVEIQKDSSLLDLGTRKAVSVAVSPDGNNVYVAGYLDDAIGVFARNLSTGALTILERERNGVDDPGDPGQLVQGLSRPWGLALSPDGEHLYAAAYRDDALVVFDREPATGRLSYVETHFNAPLDRGLDGLRAVAVSPDGAHVYTASERDDAVTVFTRNLVTGMLTFVEIQKDSPTDHGLNGARSVIVSPDGQYVYVAGRSDNAIALFTRNPTTGELSYIEREKDGVDNSGDSGGLVDGLKKVSALALSPDGENLYAAGYGERAVASFWTTE